MERRENVTIRKKNYDLEAVLSSELNPLVFKHLNYTFSLALAAFASSVDSQ